MNAQLLAIVKRCAPDLQFHDVADVVSAAQIKLETASGQASPLNAVRWSLADWLRDRTETPQPIEDTELRRELQHARRSLRSTSEEELARWDSFLARLPERERDVAIRLAAGYSVRDIGSELQYDPASVMRAKKSLRRRLGDSVLWVPILDALYDLPDTLIGRGEYATDLAEYSRPQRAADFVGKRKTRTRKTQRQTWKLARADTVLIQPTTRLRIMANYWFPGCPTHGWNRSVPTQPNRAGGAYIAITLPERADRLPDAIGVSLKSRELAGLSEGRRWLFDRGRDTYISSPVIARNWNDYD